MFIYFCDKVTGVCQNITLHPEYHVFLDEGTYNDRFFLTFSDHDLRVKPAGGTHFYIYGFHNRLYVYADLSNGETAELRIHDMLGRQVLKEQICQPGYSERDLDMSNGIYIATVGKATEVYTRKIYIDHQWQ